MRNSYRGWVAAALSGIAAIGLMASSAGATDEQHTAQAAPSEPPAASHEAISPASAIAMRQSLQNLAGRFESALLLAHAAEHSAQLVAIAQPASLPASVGTAETSLHPVLADAQQLIADWPRLMAQQQYAQAQQRWQAVQQALRSNFPSDQVLAQPELRAMWLDRGTIVDAGSPQGLAQVFDRLAAAGINTVFVETVNAGYPIYPSRVAPQQNPLTQHWDPLAAAVELGKQRHIEVHAWVWTFAAGNQRHNQILGLPTTYPGPLISANPTWAGYDSQGNLLPPGQTKPFLDPANSEVRSYLLRLLNEIANRYDVAGIQLDYVRHPFQDPAAGRTFGYGLASRQQFERLTGVDPITLSPRSQALTPEQKRQQYLWAQWTTFRTRQISTFVADASAMLRRHHPQLVISAAVFAQSGHERRQKLQQDWEAWAERGDVDWIVLMSYAANTPQFEAMIRPWVVEATYDSTLVIPGIRLFDSAPEAVFDQIQALRDLPTVGYALFAADHFDTPMQTLLNDTQGPTAVLRSQPIPQQQPFAVAAIRYQTLQREWNWLLTHDQLAMDAAELNQWRLEADALSEQLELLSANPSRRRLAQVRSRLERLHTHLNHSVTISNANSGYRLRAWQHRLATIEQLLEYGMVRATE
ncbi:MAG: family 10 glycosylhydrolase [Leptolyngbya sp. SIO4C1]|nr:family 10 glycosylhydrolase [Leptolyngbya sp. SIO4C1]